MIAVVEDGRIAETGKHDELLAKRGRYFELVEAQKGKEEEEKETSSEPNSSSAVPSRKSSYITDANGNGNGVPLLRFHNVHFCYSSRPNNWVFRGLNLSVKEGETLALCGPSGKGKSTAMQLLEAFYRPNQGSVEYLGVGMKDVNVKWMRNQIGLVEQEPCLFDLSIAENIRFGLPEATQKDIEEAAKQGNAHEFILSFLDGYETQVYM